MSDSQNRTATLEPPVHDANRDPLTNEPGSHPVGTGVGAAGGAATGAAIGGAVGGPAGALIGAAVGGIAGGLAGKGIAESVNPTEEDAYWRGTYATRPYATGRTYEDLAPAYRYGWESRAKVAADRAGDKVEHTWDQAQTNLEQGWDKVKGESRLKWQEAKDATKDAWNRVDSNLKEDNYWRDTYATRPYATGATYDDYSPAYRYGRDARTQYAGRRYEDVENDLERGWDKAKGASQLGWDKAKQAVRDAWHGVERALPGDADGDGR